MWFKCLITSVTCLIGAAVHCQLISVTGKLFNKLNKLRPSGHPTGSMVGQSLSHEVFLSFIYICSVDAKIFMIGFHVAMSALTVSLSVGDKRPPRSPLLG